MPNQATSSNRGKPGSVADIADSRSISIIVEGVGTFSLPPKGELAFLAGVGLIAAAGLIEWPVAVVVAAGHVIAHASHNKSLREFGEALEAA